jgi:hypothetical protein
MHPSNHLYFSNACSRLFSFTQQVIAVGGQPCSAAAATHITNYNSMINQQCRHSLLASSAGHCTSLRWATLQMQLPRIQQTILNKRFNQQCRLLRADILSRSSSHWRWAALQLQLPHTIVISCSHAWLIKQQCLHCQLTLEQVSQRCPVAASATHITNTNCITLITQHCRHCQLTSSAGPAVLPRSCSYHKRN